MKEFDIIRKFFAPLCIKEKGALNLQDDAAVVGLSPTMKLVVTADCLISGTHFLDTDPPNLIGRKCLGVNISDLAAMGATPKYFLLSLAIPDHMSSGWLSKFSEGLQLAQSDWGVTLIGGDTVSTRGDITINITALGEVKKKKFLSRSGASIGDKVYVTGTIGDAAIGLLVSQNKLPTCKFDDKRYFQKCYQSTEPRHKIGVDLCEIASSATDISDGLIQDMINILKASNVSGKLMLHQIPFSVPALTLLDEDAINPNTLITGGDDYELLFTAPKSVDQEISLLSERHALPVSCIGEICDSLTGPDLLILDDKDLPIPLPKIKGYEHF